MLPPDQSGINLPVSSTRYNSLIFSARFQLGALAAGVVILLLPKGAASEKSDTPLISRFIALDWIGSALSIGVTVVLLLPLQWGGNEKAWNDPAVISLFCVVRPAFILLILKC